MIQSKKAVLFITRRRCLILLVRHNEYLIGSKFEVHKHTHNRTLFTTHCQIVVFVADAPMFIAYITPYITHIMVYIVSNIINA